MIDTLVVLCLRHTSIFFPERKKSVNWHVRSEWIKTAFFGSHHKYVVRSSYTVKQSVFNNPIPAKYGYNVQNKRSYYNLQ